jgi:hypothetical protein
LEFAASTRAFTEGDVSCEPVSVDWISSQFLIVLPQLVERPQRLKKRAKG